MHLVLCMLEQLNCSLVVTAFYMLVPKKKIHICLVEVLVAVFASVLCTYLKYTVHGVEGHRSDEVANARYSIVTRSCHE